MHFIPEMDVRTSSYQTRLKFTKPLFYEKRIKEIFLLNLYINRSAVTSLNRTPVILSILFFCAGNNIAHAQLWRYLNDSPEKQKAADKALKKEASEVITKKMVAYGETLSYDIMTHTIKSFDGVAAKIDLWEKPFNGHVFHIDLPNDQLIIRDFSGLVSVHHLSHNLLEIIYSPRGGSDEGYDNVLLLGVDKGKFCIVAEMQSVYEFERSKVYGLYQLHLKLQGTNIGNYQMFVKVLDLLRSENKGEKSYDKSTNFVLKFDKARRIFYTDKQKLDAYIELEGVTPKKLHVRGYYPMINLGEYQYCFFNKIWYSVWKDVTTGKVWMSSYCKRPISA